VGAFPSKYVEELPSKLSNYAGSEQLKPKGQPPSDAPIPPRVKALYDYSTTYLGDLNFQKGDIITVSHAINKDYWSGSIGDRKGVFPSNYVEIVPFNYIDSKQFSSKVQLAPKKPIPAQVIALCNFVAQEPSDLEFRKGDIITVLEAIDKDWWKGAIGSKEGVFPMNCVEILSVPTTAELVEENTTHVIALFDYDPKDYSELTLRKGDIIQLLGPGYVHWWYGFHIGEERMGSFPLSYVGKLCNGTVPPVQGLRIGWSCVEDQEQRVKGGDKGMEIEENSRGGTEMGEMRERRCERRWESKAFYKGPL
jgi:hypothetical protein